ncbi:MAG: hypothetical protein KGJ23_07985 [Euryarchaeota archaeon]|nr:hypothetical protein [Euryarchaeota archaeon]MDE1836540.1 hypothetical protein [Euryarchaeota archaeon]MDE1879265.1 hypothetical protein [Euryarchaeota archaeon]MDE2044510.1 hypothetical protein [Thermoplasmata archaeon]
MSVKRAKFTESGPWHTVNVDGPASENVPCPACGLEHSRWGSDHVLTIRPLGPSPEWDAFQAANREGRA